MAIISLLHNSIFLKTSKTVGTSIEVDLSAFVEIEAVVTPILPPVGKHQPRNWQGPSGGDAFYNHMLSIEIRQKIGALNFFRMHRFCVERESIAKCIGHFHMRRNSSLHNNGGEFWESCAEYCDAGRFPVDTSKYTEKMTMVS